MSNREQFEVWAEENGHDTYRSGGEGAYYFQSTQWAWGIWQAATSALEAKCAALAAENAALKQSELEYDATCREEFGADWVTELTETPDTDAFLAEVRAQGIELFIDENPSLLNLGKIKVLREFFLPRVRSGKINWEDYQARKEAERQDIAQLRQESSQ